MYAADFLDTAGGRMTIFKGSGPMPRDDFSQDAVLLLGKIAGGQEALEKALRDFEARASEAIGGLRTELRHDRAETAMTTEKMLHLENGFKEMSAKISALDDQYRAMAKTIEPLVEWRKAVMLLVAAVVGGVGLVWVMFGPLVQDFTRSFVSWLWRAK